jgi:hypothetical protein
LTPCFQNPACNNYFCRIETYSAAEVCSCPWLRTNCVLNAKAVLRRSLSAGCRSAGEQRAAAERSALIVCAPCELLSACFFVLGKRGCCMGITDRTTLILDRNKKRPFALCCLLCCLLAGRILFSPSSVRMWPFKDFAIYVCSFRTI